MIISQLREIICADCVPAVIQTETMLSENINTLFFFLVFKNHIRVYILNPMII